MGDEPLNEGKPELEEIVNGRLTGEMLLIK